MTKENTKNGISWALKAVRRYCQKQKCPCAFTNFCGLRAPGGLTNAEIETVAEAVAENEEKRKAEGKSND